MSKEKEKRSINSDLSIEAESRLVSGYAALFNSESQDLGGFIEVIEPNAFEGVVERSDIFCLLNHNDDRGILARSKQGEGSLLLEIDEVGLKYMFEAPKTALGDELLEYLTRGDITGSSFAFSVENDEWEEMEDGRYKRSIKAFRQLFDVSPVWNPAYLSTSVAKRSLDEIKQNKVDQLQKELDEYFKELKNQIV